MENNQHILFVHIPKTAGTSFRMAAEEYYDPNTIFYDYSLDFIETSPTVIKNIYEENDYYKLYHNILKLERSFLSGHFPVNKYAPLYEMTNVVTFVRHPVEQVLSHYNHHKNIDKYDKGLKTFIQEPRFRNVQSKTLKSNPIETYGFIGLTEEYKSSIKMFNDLYKTKLEYKHINVKSENSLSVDDLDEETLKLIIRSNKADMKFYGDIQKQFTVRKELFDKDLPFTYGFIQRISENKISGIAFQRENGNAIEIDIFAGDRFIDTILAKNLRSGQKNVPRKGYIGFDYQYNLESQIDAKLRAFVHETGQEIK